MDINQLEVLVAVAQEKSFSRAAESLHRTQPAVSQAISRLETEIGELLFDRSSKDGTLTPAGRVLFDLAQQVLNMRQNAHTAIRELKDVQRGKLSLSANEYTVMYLLSVLPAFRSRHPHIKVEVKRSLASRIPSEILGRDAEIGLYLQTMTGGHRRNTVSNGDWHSSASPSSLARSSFSWRELGCRNRSFAQCSSLIVA